MNVYVISSVRAFIVWNAWIVVARPFMFYDLHLREYQDLSGVLMARGRKKERDQKFFSFRNEGWKISYACPCARPALSKSTSGILECGATDFEAPKL